MAAANQRVDVHYAGRVQGVGFRQTTSEVARGFAVTGYVQNLSDGRVRLVAEGTSAELQAFLQAVADRMGHLIQQAQVDRRPANGEFDQFRIRY